MSVYNGEQYLEDAIECILNQTFRDFEFIIVDDGSTDDSLQIVQDYARKDTRIQVLRNGQNIGLSASLNKGLHIARGEYIARMDADDISLSQRLEKQVAFMDAHPEVGICGSWVEIIGEFAGQVWRYPVSNDAICACMLFANTLVHSSVILRQTTLRQYNLQYDAQMRYAQDYELWSRAMFVTQFANVDHVLMHYRVHALSAGALHREKQYQAHEGVYRRVLSPLGIEYTESELRLHQQIGTYQYDKDVEFLQRARNWLEKLAQANQRVRILSPAILSAELGARWTQICLQSQAPFLLFFVTILASPLHFGGRVGFLKFWRGIRFFLGRIVSAKSR